MKAYFPYGVFVVCLMSFFLISPQECDIWWHLKVGQDILENKSWPSPDQYSYIASGREWVVHSWLADCFFYLVYQVCGFESLIGMRLLAHSIFCLGLLWLLSKNQVRLDLSFTLSVIAIYLVWHREIRPFLFSQIAVLIFYHFVRSPKPTKQLYFIMPLTMLLWVNAHPLSLYFSFLLLIILTTRILYALFNRSQVDDVSWEIIAVISIFFSFMHPTPFAVVCRFMSAPSYQSPDWRSPLHHASNGNLYAISVTIMLIIASALFFFWCKTNLLRVPSLMA